MCHRDFALVRRPAPGYSARWAEPDCTNADGGCQTEPKSRKVFEPHSEATARQTNSKFTANSNRQAKIAHMSVIHPGRYRHYKGNEYSVLGVARHSETGEELVVYRQQYGERGLWVRPKRMFVENVTVDGQEVPRFRYLGDEPGS